jgi:hypothetical protein
MKHRRAAEAARIHSETIASTGNRFRKVAPYRAELVARIARLADARERPQRSSVTAVRMHRALLDRARRRDVSDI